MSITCNITRNVNVTARRIKALDELDSALGEFDPEKEFRVTFVSMGQSHTSVGLADISDSHLGYFNSVDFKFFVKGKEIDIYNSAFFNPYCSLSMPLVSFVHNADIDSRKDLSDL